MLKVEVPPSNTASSSSRTSKPGDVDGDGNRSDTSGGRARKKKRRWSVCAAKVKAGVLKARNFVTSDSSSESSGEGDSESERERDRQRGSQRDNDSGVDSGFGEDRDGDRDHDHDHDHDRPHPLKVRVCVYGTWQSGARNSLPTVCSEFVHIGFCWWLGSGCG